MPVKKILVPVDFSDCSTNAVKYATSMAAGMKAEILLLHALHLPVAHNEFTRTTVISELARGIDADINKSFSDLLKAVPKLNEVKHKNILLHAFLSDAMLSIHVKHNFDLIIMGTKGASGLEEVIIGTNTYNTIKSINCPVIVIPGNRNFKSPRKIALASDYESISESTLKPLLSIAKLFGSEIHIIHVNKENSISFEEADNAKRFERYFKKIPHQYHLLVNENVESGIEQYLSKESIDLLTLIPRKHTLLDRLFGTQNSKSMIFHTKLPLLALHE